MHVHTPGIVDVEIVITASVLQRKARHSRSNHLGAEVDEFPSASYVTRSRALHLGYSQPVPFTLVNRNSCPSQRIPYGHAFRQQALYPSQC